MHNVDAISRPEYPSAISLSTSSSPGCEDGVRKGLTLPSAMQVVADQRGYRTRIQERFAAQRRPARLEQVAVGHRFEDITRGARLERFEEVLLVVMHRQDQDPDVWMCTVHLPGRLQPRHARHC